MSAAYPVLKPTDTCCFPKKYEGYNLYAANPFDQRPIPSQPNPWCSNELILKDRALRCAARVQPLDVYFDQAVSRNVRKY